MLNKQQNNKVRMQYIKLEAWGMQHLEIPMSFITISIGNIKKIQIWTSQMIYYWC